MAAKKAIALDWTGDALVFARHIQMDHSESPAKYRKYLRSLPETAPAGVLAVRPPPDVVEMLVEEYAALSEDYKAGYRDGFDLGLESMDPFMRSEIRRKPGHLGALARKKLYADKKRDRQQWFRDNLDADPTFTVEQAMQICHEKVALDNAAQTKVTDERVREWFEEVWRETHPQA